METAFFPFVHCRTVSTVKCGICRKGEPRSAPNLARVYLMGWQGTRRLVKYARPLRTRLLLLYKSNEQASPRRPPKT